MERKKEGPASVLRCSSDPPIPLRRSFPVWTSAVTPVSRVNCAARLSARGECPQSRSTSAAVPGRIAWNPCRSPRRPAPQGTHLTQIRPLGTPCTASGPSMSGTGFGTADGRRHRSGAVSPCQSRAPGLQCALYHSRSRIRRSCHRPGRTVFAAAAYSCRSLPERRPAAIRRSRAARTGCPKQGSRNGSPLSQ